MHREYMIILIVDFSLSALQPNEICHMVFPRVFWEVFVRAVDILSCVIAYCVVFHLFVEKHFVWVMSVPICFEW